MKRIVEAVVIAVGTGYAGRQKIVIDVLRIVARVHGCVEMVHVT